jgi:hypothetical protein
VAAENETIKSELAATKGMFQHVLQEAEATLLAKEEVMQGLEVALRSSQATTGAQLKRIQELEHI